MGDPRGQGAHRSNFPGLHQLLLMHLQLVNHAVEGPEQGEEFLRRGWWLRERREIAVGDLVHGLLHLQQRLHQHAGEVEGHDDPQGQEHHHRDNEEDHGPLKQLVYQEPFFLFPVLRDREQFLALVAQGFFQGRKIMICQVRADSINLLFNLGQNFPVTGQDTTKFRLLGGFL